MEEFQALRTGPVEPMTTILTKLSEKAFGDLMAQASGLADVRPSIGDTGTAARKKQNEQVLRIAYALHRHGEPTAQRLARELFPDHRPHLPGGQPPTARPDSIAGDSGAPATSTPGASSSRIPTTSSDSDTQTTHTTHTPITTDGVAETGSVPALTGSTGQDEATNDLSVDKAGVNVEGRKPEASLAQVGAQVAVDRVESSQDEDTDVLGFGEAPPLRTGSPVVALAVEGLSKEKARTLAELGLRAADRAVGGLTPDQAEHLGLQEPDPGRASRDPDGMLYALVAGAPQASVGLDGDQALPVHIRDRIAQQLLAELDGRAPRSGRPLWNAVDAHAGSPATTTLSPVTRLQLDLLEKLAPQRFADLIGQASGIAQAHAIPMPPVLGHDPIAQAERNRQHQLLYRIAHALHRQGTEAAHRAATRIARTHTHTHTTLPGGMPPDRRLQPSGKGSGSQPPAAVFVRGDVVAGRDFTVPQPEVGIEVAAETRSALHWAPAGEPDAVAQQLEECWTQLWGANPAPYLVRADHDPAGQRLRVYPAGAGNAVWLDYSGFARLLAADPYLAGLDRRAPVLLVIPDAARRNLQLVRAVNDTTRRRVWAHTRTPSLRPYAPGGPLHLGVDFVANAPAGQWLYHDPHPTGLYGPAPRPGTVTALNGRTYSDTDLVITPMADATGRIIGHWSMPEEDQKNTGYPYFSAAGYYRQTANFQVRNGVRAPLPVPWNTEPTTPYFFNIHGMPDRVMLQTATGSTTQIDGSNFAQLLKRVLGRAQFSPTTSIVLVSCWTGAGDGRLIQKIADWLNVSVYGPSTSSSHELADGNRLALSLLAQGVWRRADPRHSTLRTYGQDALDRPLLHPAVLRNPHLSQASTAALPNLNDVMRSLHRGDFVVGSDFGNLRSARFFDVLPLYHIIPSGTAKKSSGHTKLQHAPWHTRPDEPPFVIHAQPDPTTLRSIRVTSSANHAEVVLTYREFAFLTAEILELGEQRPHVPVILVVPGTTDLGTLAREVSNATGRRTWTHPDSTLTSDAVGFLRLGVHARPDQPQTPWNWTDPVPGAPPLSRNSGSSAHRPQSEPSTGPSRRGGLYGKGAPAGSEAIPGHDSTSVEAGRSIPATPGPVPRPQRNPEQAADTHDDLPSGSPATTTLSPVTRLQLDLLEKLAPQRFADLIGQASGIAQAHAIPMPPVLGHDPIAQAERNRQHQLLYRIAHALHRQGTEAAHRAATRIARTHTHTHTTLPGGTKESAPHRATNAQPTVDTPRQPIADSVYTALTGPLSRPTHHPTPPSQSRNVGSSLYSGLVGDVVRPESDSGDAATGASGAGQGSVGSTLTVSFSKALVMVSEDQAAIIQLAGRLARQCLANRRNGFPLPRVRIVGHANGSSVPWRSKQGQETGLQRAGATEKVLRRGLNQALLSLQPLTDRDRDRLRKSQPLQDGLSATSVEIEIATAKEGRSAVISVVTPPGVSSGLPSPVPAPYELFGNRTVALLHDDRVYGRDFEAFNVIPTAMLLAEGWASGYLKAPSGDQGASLTSGQIRLDAPWVEGDTKPFLVRAERQTGGLIRLHTEFTQNGMLPDAVTRGQFANMVARDPDITNAEGPIILVIPGATGDRILLHTLADRTERTVWAHSGAMLLPERPGGPLIVAVVNRPDEPETSWISVEPFSGPPPTSDESSSTSETIDRKKLSQTNYSLGIYAPNLPLAISDIRGLTQAQAAKLTELRLQGIDVPRDGNCLMHSLLVTAAPALFGRRNVPLTTPEAIRKHLADLLEGEIASKNSKRTLWNFVDVQAHAAWETDFGTTQWNDSRRRDVIRALRISHSYNDASGDIAPVLAAHVFGLSISVIQPQGNVYRIGPENGHPITLVYLSRYSHWVATAK
ncbi:hypothetical protein [Streptomyces sp. NPDC056707]|uniref:hypothetical protein n=1 Tax=Streptomyces sp. NPDC056707 TaxID=3345919 RepID=UPI0036BDE7A0